MSQAGDEEPGGGGGGATVVVLGAVVASGAGGTVSEASADEICSVIARRYWSSCPNPSALGVVNVVSGEDPGGLGRVVRAGVSKTRAPVVSGDTSWDDAGVVIRSCARKEVVTAACGVVVCGTANTPV
jgi:hypothetical protein